MCSCKYTTPLQTRPLVAPALRSVNSSSAPRRTLGASLCRHLYEVLHPRRHSDGSPEGIGRSSCGSATSSQLFLGTKFHYAIQWQTRSRTNSNRACRDSSNLSATRFRPKKVASWSQTRTNLSKARPETRPVTWIAERNLANITAILREVH